MKKMFLDDLPKKMNKGKECIDWKNSAGYKVHFIYDDIEGELEILNYIPNNNPKISIKYNNKIFDIQTNNFKKCKIAKIVNKECIKFKIEVGTNIKDNKRDLTIINRKYKRKERKDGKIENEKLYKYHCNKCGFDGSEHYSIKNKQYEDELWIRECHLLNETGCSCCANQIVVKGINDIATTHPKLIKYFKNKEDIYTHTYSSGDKVIVVCPNCGLEKKSTISDFIYYGFSCPRCGDGISYPEKVMFNVLQQLNINFIKEYNKKHEEWVQKYRYDFYFELNNEKYIIETHGEQHYYNNFKNVNSLTLEEIKQNDEYKKQLAIKNGIKNKNYIIIDCRKSEIEFIKQNIINSRLNDIFDLKKIDWTKIGQDSEKSLVKEVCDYWHLHNEINGENLSTTDLISIFNCSGNTIRIYLKRGTKLGWCNYDSKEESKKARIRQRKSIEVFKDGKSLGVFESCRYIDRNSEKLFGEKLLNGNISAVCLGKLKQYKGYTFKFI